MASMAGGYVADRDIVRMWAVMVLSLLGILEPGTALPIVASVIFLLLNSILRATENMSVVVFFFVLCWLCSIALAVGTIRLSTQRPVPLYLQLTIGDVTYPMPIYYNIALSVVAGALGYYHEVGDVHKYVVSCGALVLAVLLPFAVRLYRRRLPLDDLPVWRHGLDDLSLLYLCTTVLSGSEIFKNWVFEPGAFLYSLMSLLVTLTAMVLALLAVTEACLLNCATRQQVNAHMYMCVCMCMCMCVCVCVHVHVHIYIYIWAICGPRCDRPASTGLPAIFFVDCLLTLTPFYPRCWLNSPTQALGVAMPLLALALFCPHTTGSYLYVSLFDTPL
jgi:hypothetical protein